MTYFIILVFLLIGLDHSGILAEELEQKEITEPIQILKIEDDEYISINWLMSVCNGEVHWQLETKKLILTVQQHQIIFTIENPIVIIDQLSYRLPAPVRIIEGIVFVPVKVLEILKERILSFQPVFDQYNKQKHLISLADSSSTVDIEKLINNFKFDVVVIDPGHGGRDPGAIGRGGTKEKTVVLDVAKRLAELIRTNLKIKVILTRDKDVFVPLKQRTKIANLMQADLFISVHANASRRHRANGFETYFLALAKNDEARAVAAMENSAIRFEVPETSAELLSDLNFILWDMTQNVYLQESSRFAEIVQEELSRKLDLENRGVNQAGFFVLNGAYMPAVLVEIAFISNYKEEKLLNQSSFREKIAQALYLSVKRYKEEYERRLTINPEGNKK